MADASPPQTINEVELLLDGASSTVAETLAKLLSHTQRLAAMMNAVSTRVALSTTGYRLASNSHAAAACASPRPFAGHPAVVVKPLIVGAVIAPAAAVGGPPTIIRRNERTGIVLADLGATAAKLATITQHARAAIAQEHELLAPPLIKKISGGRFTPARSRSSIISMHLPNSGSLASISASGCNGSISSESPSRRAEDAISIRSGTSASIFTSIVPVTSDDEIDNEIPQINTAHPLTPPPTLLTLPTILLDPSISSPLPLQTSEIDVSALSIPPPPPFDLNTVPLPLPPLDTCLPLASPSSLPFIPPAVPPLQFTFMQEQVTVPAPPSFTSQQFGHAIYPYTAAGENEISLIIGDMVQVLQLDAGDGWSQGTCVQSSTGNSYLNRPGLYPRAYVRLLD